MASPTRWTWVWVNSGSWWWTGRPGMWRFMGSQRVGHNWVTELNWTESTNSWSPYYLSLQEKNKKYQKGSNRIIMMIQFSSVAQSCVTFCTPWTAARHVSLSITNSQSPPKPMSIESVMPSNHLILCRPLLLLPSIFPSIRVFSNESALPIVAKVVEFQLQHQSFQWTPRTDLLRMDWLDLIAVQGTLKSLLQHHSSKASILLRSAD